MTRQDIDTTFEERLRSRFDTLRLRYVAWSMAANHPEYPNPALEAKARATLRRAMLLWQALHENEVANGS